MVALFSLPGISLGVAKIINNSISIPACSKLKFAKCNCCNKRSKRVHSSYVRVLRDLSVSTYCVSVSLTVRKFFCENPECGRKIFTEQPGPEIKAYSRMTNRTRVILQNIFLEVSAQKGSYIAALISLPVSSSTALRIVDSLPIPSKEKVTVLGIDDWAYRKGLTYGTILVNIETGEVIDLLTGRDGASLKKWLAKHPEVKIVTRDRASAYSCAVSSTLPDAIQVADRFHLLKNLSDCVYDIIRIEYRNLANSMTEDSSQEVMPVPEIPDEESGKVPLKERGEMNDYLKGRFEKVKEMIKDGVGFRTIARTLRMSRNTVRSYANMDVLPGKSIYYKNNYNEYQGIIEKGLSEGKSITVVFESIKKAGFKGGRTALYKRYKDYIIRTNLVVNMIAKVKHTLISPRKISKYLGFADLSKIKDPIDMEFMVKLLSKNSILEDLRHHILSFKTLLLGNDDSLLDDWMKRTLNIGKSQLKTFIKGLKSDIDAVRNAIITNWSNGQVEGQVNRLKSIKRQMYGRAGFELLRRKVVLSKVG
jgi:transposase